MNIYRFLFVCVAVLVSLLIHADEKPVEKHFKNWKLSSDYSAVDSIAPDTTHLNFQLYNHIDRFSIANAYRGNLGSPIQSKIFLDRPQQSEFIFADAYFPYLSLIESATFYNTKTPFSGLYYLTGGTKFYEDEQIRFLFTVNPNKKLNVGTTLDYIFARGEYANLATKRFAGSLFGTYDSKHYKATAHFSTNNLSNYENGGIEDTTYINGNITYPPQNIPVNIEGYSNFKHNQIFLNHQYNIGIERAVRITEDSVRMDYVPVTVFAHTFKLDDLRKRYYEGSVEKTFYDTTYLADKFTNDTTSMLLITNRFSVSMAEEFNKWLQFGLTAFIENEIYGYKYQIETELNIRYKSNTRIGGVLSKQQGKLIKYNILGSLTLLGPKAGDFNIDGNLGGYFNIGNQKVALVARAFMRTDEPSWYLNYYRSNHFRWENDFSKIFRTHVGGDFAIPTLNFNFNLAVENLSNYIYFNDKALPQQHIGGIQLVSADLKQKFKLGRFALENNVVYQLSSRQDILPLPTLALFHNLYYHDLWFKVLSIQIGADVRYHTAYYAPSYMPATGQFYVQDKIKIGNYPVMNVYFNAHLKRTRFFAQYYHVNQLFMSGDYYSLPYYPLNPATFRMGITWNFYD